MPVTPAYIKNQLKYGKPMAESTFARRAQSEETPLDETIERTRQAGLSSAAAPNQYDGPYSGTVATYPGAVGSAGYPPAEVDSKIFGSLYSDASFASSFNPDNVSIERHPVILGFLVSFVVDARGGAMRGCRHSGLRVIVPPGRACAPTRITCKLVKREKLSNPPPLMDGESLATRVLKMGPVGAAFSGPVLLEVPHFASLRGKEREVTVLRSDDGHTWREHPIVTTEDAVQRCLSGNFEGEELESAEDLYQRRVTRILTTDFPVYFALVTRIRQESKVVGPDGGIISSTVVPQVQVVFPQGAITKSIRIGLQAHPVSDELVTKTLGDRVSVSPIVTIEPRHRKFHQPIAITIPLPPKSPLKGAKTRPAAGATPTLRLLCSMTGGTSPVQWEDITGASPLTLINDCVNFTTNISARFWLIDVASVKEALPMATELYREATVVPFVSKFVLFAKRRNLTEARLRVFCVTDDKMEKTLESQEHFVEVARSRDVEVAEGRRQYVDVIGNMAPVVKTSTEPIYVNFRPFRENRLPLVVRLRDLKAEPAGQVLFMADPRIVDAPQPTPICVLNLVLPGLTGAEDTQSTPDLDVGDIQLSEAFQMSTALGPVDQISRAELRLTDIADALQSDWVPLARQLGLTQSEIIGIQRDYTYVSEQVARGCIMSDVVSKRRGKFLQPAVASESIGGETSVGHH
jgi:ankyrin